MITKDSIKIATNIAHAQLRDTTHVKHFLDYLSNITGVKSETIFTVLTTLFVFGAGIVINWIVNLVKEARQRRSYKRTINLLLWNLSEICRKQYIVTTKDIEIHNLLDDKTLHLKVQVYAPLQFLNKMDFSLFIKNYVAGFNKKLKVKAASKVFRILGYANILESDYAEKVKYFLDRMVPMQDLYLKNLFALEAIGRDVLNVEVIDYSFKKELIELFENWKPKSDDTNFRNSFTNLISPILRLLERYNLEPLGNNIHKIAKESHLAYSEIAHTDAYIKEHLRLFAYENRRISKQLMIILKIFNYETKDRSFR